MEVRRSCRDEPWHCWVRKNPAASFFPLLTRRGKERFYPGGLCSNSSGCQQWLFQRSVLQQLCSLAWLSHVPMSPCHAASGGQRG